MIPGKLCPHLRKLISRNRISLTSLHPGQVNNPKLLSSAPRIPSRTHKIPTGSPTIHFMGKSMVKGSPKNIRPGFLNTSGPTLLSAALEDSPPSPNLLLLPVMGNNDQSSRAISIEYVHIEMFSLHPPTSPRQKWMKT